MPANCPIQLQWLGAAEGGRRTPIRVGVYKPTARFVGEENQFSVWLELTGNASDNPSEGTLRLLNPDLADIERRLYPGVTLEIMEGPRIVARATIQDPTIVLPTTDEAVVSTIKV